MPKVVVDLFMRSGEQRQFVKDCGLPPCITDVWSICKDAGRTIYRNKNMLRPLVNGWIENNRGSIVGKWRVE